MARVRHCTFVVRKKRMNILEKQEYQNPKEFYIELSSYLKLFPHTLYKQ